MPRPSTLDRARAYLAVMPPSVSGSGGHNACFAAACALVKGFALSVDQARPLLDEFNRRCAPPWSERELIHKLNQAERTGDARPRGYLAGEDGGPPEAGAPKPAPLPPLPQKPTYDLVRLRECAGDWARTVDLVWLANRSTMDPATMSSADFLQALYGEEKVLMFNHCNARGQQITQGEALWPGEAPLQTGRYGVWYLPQPVDGEFHPNPRSVDKKTGLPKRSRRSEESVLRYRYLVLESDEAPAREWLGALAQWPLRIAAIYTSGGRSVHALVQLDARTKGEWDEMKRELAPGINFMLSAGLDPGVLSAVRLSRLPQAWREGKVREKDGYVSYEKFPRPALQKLLYINPKPEAQRLVDVFPKRDVEEVWCKHAAGGISDADDTGGRWLKRGLAYYARVSQRVRVASAQLNWRQAE